jgi:hypothetical protein
MGCVLRIIGTIIVIVILIWAVTHISEILQFVKQLLGIS